MILCAIRIWYAYLYALGIYYMLSSQHSLIYIPTILITNTLVKSLAIRKNDWTPLRLDTFCTLYSYPYYVNFSGRYTVYFTFWLKSFFLFARELVFSTRTIITIIWVNKHRHIHICLHLLVVHVRIREVSLMWWLYYVARNSLRSGYKFSKTSRKM